MRRALVVLLLATVAAGAFLSLGPPRLLAVNSALRIEYPWFRPAAALVVAAAGCVLAFLGCRWWSRALAALVAVAGLGAGAHLALYRVQADGDGVLARGLFGTTRLGWREVERVDAGPGLLLLTGAGRRVRVDTTDFKPEQRAALDRTVARRLQEPRP